MPLFISAFLGKKPSKAFVLVCFFALSTTAASYSVFEYQRILTVRAAYENLGAISELKLKQISTWLSERRGDAEVLRDDKFLSYHLSHEWLQPSAIDTEQGVRARLSALKRLYQYDDVQLFNAEGKLLVFAKDNQVAPREQEIVREALNTNRIVFSDLFLSSGTGESTSRLDFAVPIPDFNDERKISGVVLLRTKPADFLYPLIQSWPTPSSTAETLLVRREGDDIVFLNELRHKQGTALQFKLPMSSNVFATTALQGHTGIFEGVDYRAKEGIAVIKSVPDTSWYMIAKIDKSEIYAPIRRLAWLAASATFVLICGAAMVGWLWQRQYLAVHAARHYQDQLDRQLLAQRFDYLTKYANDIILLLNDDCRLAEINDRALGSYGYSRDELLGMRLWELTPKDMRAQFDGLWHQLDQQGELIFELAQLRKDGTIFPVEISARRIEMEGRKYFQVIVRDITERKRLESALKTLNERLEKRLEEQITNQYRLAAIVESSDDAIISKDLDGNITSWNAGAERLYGYSASEVLGRPESILIPFGCADEGPAILDRIKRAKCIEHYETKRLRKDREIIDVSLTVSPIKDSHGEIIGASKIVRDITEKKSAEEQLRAASLYARSLIEASLDPLVTISNDGKITDVNRATEEVTGKLREQLIGSDFSEYFTEPDKAREGYQTVFAQGFVKDYPLAIRHTTGRVTEVLYNATFYRNENGEVGGVFAAARDITERKQAEEQLRAAWAFTSSLIEASLDPLVTISPDGKITGVNRATEEVTGVKREHLISSDFSEYFTEPDRARKGYQTVFLLGAVKDYPLAIRHVSGRVTDVLYNATVFRNETGEVTGVFAAARDITERKRAEDELRRAHDQLELRVEERTLELAQTNQALQEDIKVRMRVEEQLRKLNETLEQRVSVEVAKNREKDLLMIQQSRLAAMGEMVGNIAHQWRQPLNALSLVLSNLKEAYDFGELNDEYLERATASGHRLIKKMSTTINDFRNFFRPDKESIPFNALVQINEAISLVDASFKNNDITIELQASCDFRLVGFPNEYSQVLLNLFANAKEAIQSRHVAPGRVTIRLDRTGDFGRVSVADNGGGIPEDVEDKVFEPYFSTKAMGTGIGLYMSKMIIEHNMNGKLSAHNVDGGAEFVIETPLAQESAST